MIDLKISVSEARVISSSKSGHWFPTMLLRLEDDSIVLGFSVGRDELPTDLVEGTPHALLKSFDNGWNWFLLDVCRFAIGQTLPDTVFEDGTVYGTFHPLIKPNGDIYCLGYRSKNNLRSWEGPEEVCIYFPDGKMETGIGMDAAGRTARTVRIAPQCAFEGNITRGSNGDLLRIADAKFKGDKFWRVCLLKSTNEGKSWTYISTIADPNDIPADFNESALLCLPKGELLCMMRTDNHEEFKKGSNPMYQSKSKDGGKTWSKPAYAGVWGVRPKLLQLQNGLLVCSYGRVSGSPTLGDRIMFSQDEGEAWTNHTEIFNGPSTGYTSILEIRPNEILYVYDNLGLIGCGMNNNIEMVTVKVEG